MSIVKTMTQADFIDGLKGDGFSYDGAIALYTYYDELSEELSEPIEFDHVAIRCDWTEYDSIAEAYRDHYGDDSDLPEEQRRTTDEQMLEYFEDNTQTIECDNGHILVMAF